MNIIKLLLVVFAIHFTLMLCGIADIPGTSLYSFITNPMDWGGTDFLSLIADLFLAVGAVAIIAGTVLTRSDIFLFAGLASVFLSFGLALAELFMLVKEQSNETLAIILISPIILIYVVTTVQFWRGRA